MITKGINKTGIFFKEQTIQHIIDAVKLFEKQYSDFSTKSCIENAKKFDHGIFKNNIRELVNDAKF